uniref:Protein phosphatase 1D n=1 Tax=Cacopsylla melanoneura TaxID=428564 RepID=A0A8D8LI80_9HEMI
MSGIGVNLRVTGHCNQGGRKYMEDMFSVAYQQTEDLNDLEYAFFGIFDGHGGVEAATYAKEHLLDSIVQQKSFWSNNDDDVLHAIHEGYINTHQAMWKEQGKWQRTQSGLPSTSGTTATVAFIMKSKIYVGHVGDSMLVLGFQDENDKMWKCLELTKEHKPECPEEIKRITKAGGKVVRKNGVPRVVWNRPKVGHKGPVRRSTAFDEIPFLAVARSLGDFWSYNSELDKFVVSPEPDVGVIEMDTAQHKCLIFGTDGLWNMLSAQDAVDIVHFTEMRNEQTDAGQTNNWINPSKCLVDEAIEKWKDSRTRADNTSVVTLLIDPPGPPPRTKYVKPDSSCNSNSNSIKQEEEEIPAIPQSGGMAIFTRSPGSPKQELINTLYRQSAAASSANPCSKKNRMIANILRPYEQIMKSRAASSTSSPSSSSSTMSSTDSSLSSPCSSSSSPAHSSTGSVHSTVSGASVVPASNEMSASSGSSSRSGHSIASSVVPSSPSTRSSQSTVSSVAPSIASSTRSAHCTNPGASVTTSTRSVSESIASPSTRSSHSTVSSACVANEGTNRSNQNDLESKNSSNGAVSEGVHSSGRVSATKALTNQMAQSVQTSSKRKRFRMDEKRSSLPLNMGFEESSGNSDTENERLGSVSPQSLPASPRVKTTLKKQRVELERRHLISAGAQASTSSSSTTSNSNSTTSVMSSTRTLRSDTMAAIPIKTLRSRNVNMSMMTPSGAFSQHVSSGNVGCSPRSKSLGSSSTQLSSSSSNAGGVVNKKLRWNKR